MIDIGANVGDSVAIVRMHCEIPILCIEGAPQFFEYLSVNAGALRGVELEPVFIGAAGDHPAAIEVQSGNARIVLGAHAAEEIPIRTLSKLLQGHPRFATAKLIKIDAEGFDCKIIAAETKLLALMRPVLFFEYQPLLSRQAGYDSFLVFSELASLGYSALMVYQASGDYLLSINLTDTRVLEDLHHYYGATLGGYCDLVAFHSDDADIAHAARDSELLAGTSGHAL